MDLIDCILLMIPLSIYLSPTLWALARESDATRRVAVLNVFFGWTLIGWIAAWIIVIRAPSLA